MTQAGQEFIRIVTGEDEVDEGQGAEGLDGQAQDYGQHEHSQHDCRAAEIVNLQHFLGDQGRDADGS